jgi:hypothetical protein
MIPLPQTEFISVVAEVPFFSRAHIQIYSHLHGDTNATIVFQIFNIISETTSFYVLFLQFQILNIRK